MAEQAAAWRIFVGGALNAVLLLFPLTWLSGALMDVAAAYFGEPVSWPQISFMSAYPEDVRNGYLLFVVALLVLVFVCNGLLAGVLGASVGKAMLGVRYVSADGGAVGMAVFLRRGASYCLLLSLILAPGPLLGFVFGEAADPISMACLILAIGYCIWALLPLGQRTVSPMNQWLGMRPVLRH